MHFLSRSNKEFFRNTTYTVCSVVFTHMSVFIDFEKSNDQDLSKQKFDYIKSTTYKMCLTGDGTLEVLR